MGQGWTGGRSGGKRGAGGKGQPASRALGPWRGVGVGAGARAAWPGRRSLVALLEQQQVYLLERGPVLRVPPPAAQHQLVHGVGADGGLREVGLWKQKREHSGKRGGRAAASSLTRPPPPSWRWSLRPKGPTAWQPRPLRLPSLSLRQDLLLWGPYHQPKGQAAANDISDWRPSG